MNVYAYCTLPAREAVKVALGVEPDTSPPMTPRLLGPLPKVDLIYIRLHGLPAIPNVWFGETSSGDWIEALTERNIKGADLGGAVVVLANCYGTTSALTPLLYEAGASVVIAGDGPNYAANSNRAIGADLLVKWLANALKRGLPPSRAMQWAKMRLALTSWRRADRDALAFRFLRPVEV